MNDREKRQGLRVSFKTQIVLRYGEAALHLEGDSKNLSRNGILIRTDREIPLNTPCQLELTLAGTTPPVVLSMTGEVIRRAPEGYGIRFGEMDLDTYTLLKEIVRHNAMPDQI